MVSNPMFFFHHSIIDFKEFHVASIHEVLSPSHELSTGRGPSIQKVLVEDEKFVAGTFHISDKRVTLPM